MSKKTPPAADDGAERITWTRAEIVEFDRLIEEASSPNQMTRLNARLDQKAFVEHHGKAKCDAMWAHMESGGKKEKRD